MGRGKKRNEDMRRRRKRNEDMRKTGYETGKTRRSSDVLHLMQEAESDGGQCGIIRSRNRTSNDGWLIGSGFTN